MNERRVKIRVEYLFVVTELRNKREEDVVLEDPTIRGLLNDLSGRYGEEVRRLFWDSQTGRRSQYLLTLVNGDLVHEEDTPLHEGDLVLLMPPLAGG